MLRVLIPLAIKRTIPDDKVPIHFIRETYLTKIFEKGLEPVLVPISTPLKLLRNQYQSCDGVLMTGGGDIDPRLYNKKKHPKTKLDDPRRDKMEIQIVRWAVRDKKPFLGICRGCQVLAVAQGGNLIQHLPDVATVENHGLTEGGSAYQDILELKNGHRLILENKSAAAKLVGKTRLFVKTAHHQAILKPGRGLRIAGRSPAGVVEIVESVNKNHWCFGIQSHPEAETKGGLEQFFDDFVRAMQVRHRIVAR
ncbi:MAG TPA: gamma-glutamyl-gamma-aminobutyrate hydrolase family protein [Candidatus Paceibacterota bacterium]